MAPSSKPSVAPVAQKQSNGPAPQATSATDSNAPAVKWKKQKRRQKLAAKQAAEQALGGGNAHRNNPSPPQQNGRLASPHSDYDVPEYDESYRDTRGFYTDGDAEAHFQMLNQSKKKKKKNSRPQDQQDLQDPYGHPSMPGSFHHNDPRPPPLENPSVPRPAHAGSRDRIWNTSTAEERERIKEFWLELDETDRRSLVKVEKEAVLKKMKEQQRNSCSCTICGRKRTAIEEELEVLYDAYYEELEQYANHQQIDGTVMPPPGAYPTMSRSRPQLPPSTSRGRMVEDFGLEEGDDEGYSEDDDSELYEEYEEESRGPASEFFNFGNSLTVQGGILTVADDLLKNDGKKFIEMMEQLAERRMAREKMHIGRYEQVPARHPSLPRHDHGPPIDDEEDYEEDEDDDYDSGDEYDDEEEMEAMSEEQRMEEGRRMFQIFAARMFEQRVLTAYREKVAKERQDRLIEELNDEDALKAQREAKKAKKAQKEKDKKKQQKAAKEEERLKREAERAAEIAAAKAIEEKKAEELRLRKEQQRKKKEAEKKAQEEEKQRKELEKQQKLREQQAETERRQREAKEKEKKRKEEMKKKERDEREKEAKLKKDKEREDRDREAKAKAEREASRSGKDDGSRQQAPPVPVVPAISRKAAAPVVPSIPPGLQPTSSSNHASPHLHVATPVIPKAPSPVKTRQASASQQDSHHSSPKSTQMPSDSSTTSASSGHQHGPPGLPPIPKSHGPPHGQHPGSIAPPPGIQAQHYPAMGSPSLSGFAPTNYNPAPGMPPPMSRPDMFPPQPMHPQFRQYPPPGNFGYPPGIPRQNLPHGRGSPVDGPSPPAPIGPSASQYVNTHSRQPSGSYDRASLDHGPTQPIARPHPIEKPSSLSQRDENDVEDLSKRLGSSALGDSMEDSPDMKQQEPRGGMAPGGPRSGRLGFGPSTFPDLNHPRANNFGPPGGNTWGSPQMPMGAMPNQPSWSAAPGPSSGWPASSFGTIGGGGGRINPAHLRFLACRACTQLSASNPPNAQNGDYHSLPAIMRQMDLLKMPTEGPIIESELIKVLEAEGNNINGGGSFETRSHDGHRYAKYEAHIMPYGGHMAGVPGEIGSPIVGGASPFVNRGFPLGGTPGL